MTNTLKVTVQDTENIIFEGEVERITSHNEMGQFDVYPMHANFISIIHTQLDLYHNHQKVKELKIEQAVMKVKKDEVQIFLGIEILLIDDINNSSSNPVVKK
jgi:F0F1-type ATP synthase epsilon subunit